MFSINQPLFLQKTPPLHPITQIFILDWDLNLSCKEFSHHVSIVHGLGELSFVTTNKISNNSQKMELYF